MNVCAEGKLSSKSNRLKWETVPAANLNSLFELGLLSTAQPQSAQASLLISISSNYIASQPDMVGLRAAVASHSIRSGVIDSPTELINASSMIRRALRPIIQLGCFPHICYVLRMLVGCATSRCAAMLGIDDTALSVVLGAAILQVQAVMDEQRKRPAGRLLRLLQEWNVEHETLL